METSKSFAHFVRQVVRKPEFHCMQKMVVSKADNKLCFFQGGLQRSDAFAHSARTLARIIVSCSFKLVDEGFQDF